MCPPCQAQGVVKDLDAELLRHLAQGTAFLQVSTKLHPRGELRGRVGANPCPPHPTAGQPVGSRLEWEMGAAALLGLPYPRRPGGVGKQRS